MRFALADSAAEIAKVTPEFKELVVRVRPRQPARRA